jgi:hypothetical protein
MIAITVKQRILDLQIELEILECFNEYHRTYLPLKTLWDSVDSEFVGAVQPNHLNNVLKSMRESSLVSFEDITGKPVTDVKVAAFVKLKDLYFESQK